MKLVNFFFLKNMNGMFFYCLDYVADQEVVILVRKGREMNLPKLNENLRFVEIDSFFGLLRFIFKNDYEVLYCPTPHPIPFAAKQVITLHDLYPFMGILGALKYTLMVIGAMSSRSRIAVINRILIKNIFVKNIPVGKIYAPNPISLVDKNSINELEKKSYKPKSKFSIGLIGTDSTKKNYNDLFSILPTNLINKCAIYGNVSDYSIEIMDLYSKHGLTHVTPEKTNLVEFINSCQGIVSVAKGEGFGRPIAKSLLLGKPIFLIDDPVFREFFDKSANFYNNIYSMGEDLSDLIRSNEITLEGIDMEPFLKKVEIINKNFMIAQKAIFGVSQKGLCEEAL